MYVRIFYKSMNYTSYWKMRNTLSTFKKQLFSYTKISLPPRPQCVREVAALKSWMRNHNFLLHIRILLQKILNFCIHDNISSYHRRWQCNPIKSGINQHFESSEEKRITRILYPEGYWKLLRLGHCSWLTLKLIHPFII